MRKWLPWAAMALLVIVSLTVGARVGSGKPELSKAARVAQLDSELRCPSCADLSVAASDAPSALYIRKYVSFEVSVGASNSEIIGFLESRYGQSVLLSPSNSGGGAAIWWLPIALVILASGIGVWRFARPRSGIAAMVSVEDENLVQSALEVRKARANLAYPTEANSGNEQHPETADHGTQSGGG